MKRDGISGKVVVVAFLLVVAVISIGLWISLLGAKQKFEEANVDAGASIAAHQKATGWFRVTLETGEGGLPFYLKLPSGEGEIEGQSALVDL